ncbi:MAG: hypothetical protein OXI30_00785 [Chloroflexota bacterium]|nr:hypothetical protein [Chloroflexota bacterium]
MSQMILAPGGAIYHCLAQLIKDADRVFFAGLPGVGKSLLLQQMTLMARAAGRRATLLQWDVARQPFETPRYPLANGATHPLVIRATGAWLRGALVEWAAQARTGSDMLIGEVPLNGGRFMEIARPADDEAEALLRDSRTRFVIPVPSVDVRALIESRREHSIAAPRHANEAHDAPPDLLRALWQEVYQVAVALALAPATACEAPYSPQVYAAVYRHLLRHRQALVLPIDEALQPSGSVYEHVVQPPVLQASAAQAEAILARLEAAMTPEQAIAGADRWYEV